MPGIAARPNLSRSLDRALAIVLVAGFLMALLEAALLPYDGPAGALIVVFPVLFLVYLGAGVVAWYRRPGNRMGALIIFAGLAVYFAGLGNSGLPALATFGVVTATLVLATLVHLLHAFPSGQLRGWGSTTTVVLAYVTALVLQAPSYLLDRDSHPGLAVAHRPDLVATAGVVQSGMGAIVMISTALLLVHRVVVASDVHRRILIRLYGYGAFAVLALISIPNVVGPALGLSATVQALLQIAVFAGIPVAFALGVVRGGFAKTRELEELGSWLGAVDRGKPSLEAALADTLGDPSLRLSFWVAAAEMFVDHHGDVVSDDVGGVERGRVEVSLEGKRVGVITYNAGLIADPEQVRAAGRIVAIAVDRDRLTAELRASRRALQRSRERLVVAADEERERIAQDLHDGLQVQLVLLGIRAQQLAHTGETDGVYAGQAIDLRRGIDDAAADLRRLAHAVMPAALTDLGLAAALEDLVDRMPIPTALELDGSSTHAAAVERTAYFVVAEALANTVKHAAATRASVRVSGDDSVLAVEVSDDGAGGASLGAGTGLRGLADRVDVLGGTMTVESPVGSGTSLRVSLPCA